MNKKGTGVFLLLIFLLPACGGKKIVVQEPQVVIPPPPEPVPVVQKRAFSPGFLMKKQADGKIVAKNSTELLRSIENNLLESSYLPLAQHLLLDQKTYSLQQKIAIYNGMQKMTSDEYTRDVLAFFAQIIHENESYLILHPITHLEASLVSPLLDSSSFLNEHRDMRDEIFSIDELYKQGNNLLQEAVRLNNANAVHYLMAQGVTPRYLSDPRGSVFTLEWADKHGSAQVLKELVKNINAISESKTTLLDDLLYQDPAAAQLVAKHGGKTAVELL